MEITFLKLQNEAKLNADLGKVRGKQFKKDKNDPFP